MPSRPNSDTQEGRLLAVLEDGFSHTLHDWSRPDRYTGRNAVSRLKKRGYPIISWFSKVHGLQAYRLPLSQGELRFADRPTMEVMPML